MLRLTFRQKYSGEPPGLPGNSSRPGRELAVDPEHGIIEIVIFDAKAVEIECPETSRINGHYPPPESRVKAEYTL